MTQTSRAVRNTVKVNVRVRVRVKVEVSDKARVRVRVRVRVEVRLKKERHPTRSYPGTSIGEGGVMVMRGTPPGVICLVVHEG